MRGLFTYFVYGSWWVALCATGIGLLTWFELKNDWLNVTLMVFITGSTLVIYNLNMLSGLNELRKKGTDSERHQWCMKHEKVLKVNTGIGVTLSIISAFFMQLDTILILIPFGVLAIIYVVPILRINGERTKLREFGLTKIFMIATVWTSVTAMVPMIESQTSILNHDSLWIMAERWIFILAITIPFDIRDMENDRKKNVRTIPSVVGWKKARALSLVLLFLFGLSTFLRTQMGNGNLMEGYVISTVSTMLIVAIGTPERDDMYCSFLLEGSMMLQATAVILLA